jgi:hypothetical protein
LFVDDNEAANSPSQVFAPAVLQPKGGDIKYRDLNGDGKIDAADQTFIGNPTLPQMVYGFGLSAPIKTSICRAFSRGRQKCHFLSIRHAHRHLLKAPIPTIHRNTQLLKAYADDHWSEDTKICMHCIQGLARTGPLLKTTGKTATGGCAMAVS